MSFSPLSRELEKAALLARRPLFADRLRSVGLPVPERDDWGVDHVQAGLEFYEPREDGTLSLIVPAYEGPELVDLVACAFGSRQMRTRHGIASLLGFDWIEWAFLGNEPLQVFDDAFSWMRAEARGVVVLDWTDAPYLLREVPALRCESEETAERLVRAFERPRPYPPVLVSPVLASNLSSATE